MNKKQGLLLLQDQLVQVKAHSCIKWLCTLKRIESQCHIYRRPVEQILKGITQISVNTKAGITYASSFKAILRCDPDVIFWRNQRCRNSKICFKQA